MGASIVGMPEPVDPAFETADDIPAALRAAGRVLAAARQEGTPLPLAAALVDVARLRFRLGQYDAAVALAGEAISLAPPDAASRADAFQVLANCAADIGSPVDAEAYYWSAADLAREIGYHRAHAAALHGLAAGVYLPRGQFKLALAAEEEVHGIATRHGPPEWLICPLITISQICQSTGERARRRASLDELSVLAAPGSAAEGHYLCISGALALDEGELKAGLALLARARSIAETSGEPSLNFGVRLELARYSRLAGDAPAARAWADDALAFARRVEYQYEQGKALIERGRAAWLCGSEASAQADLGEAAGILEDLGAVFDLTRAHFLLATLLQHQGRPEAATAWLDAARRIVEGGYAFLLEQERALAFPLLAAYQTGSDTALARSCAVLLDRLKQVPPPPLRVMMLGCWEVWQGAHCVQKRTLRQRRAGELLALLVLTPGGSLSFEQVAETLFPERDAAAAQVLFHHATSALRHALEPDLPDKFPSRYLEVEDGQVTLIRPPGSWVDVEGFEAHCRRSEWENALELYGGDLLPGYRYSDWALPARERVAFLYERALLAAGEARLADGRFDASLDAARRLVALEPWHEQAVLLGMRACAALNDVAGARRLYLKLARTLRDELDTVPQAEVQDFYRSLTPTAKHSPS